MTGTNLYTNTGGQEILFCNNWISRLITHLPDAPYQPSGQMGPGAEVGGARLPLSGNLATPNFFQTGSDWEGPGAILSLGWVDPQPGCRGARGWTRMRALTWGSPCPLSSGPSSWSSSRPLVRWSRDTEADAAPGGACAEQALEPAPVLAPHWGPAAALRSEPQVRERPGLVAQKSRAAGWEHHVGSAGRNSVGQGAPTSQPPSDSSAIPVGQDQSRGSHEATHNAGGLAGSPGLSFPSGGTGGPGEVSPWRCAGRWRAVRSARSRSLHLLMCLSRSLVQGCFALMPVPAGSLGDVLSKNSCWLFLWGEEVRNQLCGRLGTLPFASKF